MMKQSASSSCPPKESITAIILIQYLLTIASVIVSLILWYIRSEEDTFARYALQILVALSSNCCGVACTLSYIKREDENKTFQPKRTIIIVLSLVINLILTIILSSDLVMLTDDQLYRLLVPLGAITMILVAWLVSLQCNVEGKNADISKELNNVKETTRIINVPKKSITNGKKLKTRESEEENINDGNIPEE